MLYAACVHVSVHSLHLDFRPIVQRSQHFNDPTTFVVNTLQDTPSGRVQRHSFGVVPYCTPQPLRTLVLACTCDQPEKRPTSAAMLDTLLDLQRQCGFSTQVRFHFIPRSFQGFCIDAPTLVALLM